MENKKLYSVIVKINNLLTSSPYYRSNSLPGKHSSDLNSVAEGLDELITALVVIIFSIKKILTF